MNDLYEEDRRHSAGLTMTVGKHGITGKYLSGISGSWGHNFEGKFDTAAEAWKHAKELGDKHVAKEKAKAEDDRHNPLSTSWEDRSKFSTDAAGKRNESVEDDYEDDSQANADFDAEMENLLRNKLSDLSIEVGAEVLGESNLRKIKNDN